MDHRKSRGGVYRVSYGSTLKVSSIIRSLEVTLRGIASGTRPNGKTEYEILNFQPIASFQNLLTANQIE